MATLGASLGSFGAVVAYRVPRRESVVRPRSRCPACSRQLAAVDNVPVLSWLLLRGRCRSCAASIPVRYALAEAVTAALFVALWFRFGLSPVLPAYLILGAGLVVLSSVDAERHLVPNRILYPLAAMFVALLVVGAVLEGRPSRLLAAATVGYVCFDAFFLMHMARRQGMGFGDVRFAGLMGLALGWLDPWLALAAVVIGFGAGTVYALATRTRRVPLIPFLSIGILASVLAGEPIIRWWLGLLG